MKKVANAYLPTKFGNFRILIYQNPISLVENIVLILHKNNEKMRPFIRIHSECATGEVFSSLKCDCKFQLENSMKLLQKRANGAIIYLRNHEGRGIGLINKIKAYSLQEIGFTTITANEELKLQIDARDYQDAIAILRDLKINDFDIYTGNPEKLKVLSDNDFQFKQIIPKIKSNCHNHNYLHEKKCTLKHNIVIQSK